jgi:hypothetical protein
MSQKISQKKTPLLISLLSCYDKCQDSGNWNVLILQKSSKKQESAIFNTNLQSFDRFCWQSFARLEFPIYLFLYLPTYSLSSILLIFTLWLKFVSYLIYGNHFEWVFLFSFLCRRVCYFDQLYLYIMISTLTWSLAIYKFLNRSLINIHDPNLTYEELGS